MKNSLIPLLLDRPPSQQRNEEYGGFSRIKQLSNNATIRKVLKQVSHRHKDHTQNNLDLKTEATVERIKKRYLLAIPYQSKTGDFRIKLIGNYDIRKQKSYCLFPD